MKWRNQQIPLLAAAASVLFPVVRVLGSSAPGSTSINVNNHNTVKRPDWLNVDRDTIQQYMDLARQRHQSAIERARENYNIADEATQKYPADDTVLSQLHLKPYKIESSGKLPDFQDELEKKLFVTTPTPLFTKEECQECIEKAEAHFAAADGKWSTLPSGQYDVAGFWIRDVPAVHEWFLKMLQKRLFPLLVQTFPHFCENVNDLVVDNAYLFKYTPETGRRTDVHTDSGCLSFTISLNSNQEYQGGGTWFEGLQQHTDNKSRSNNNNSNNVIEMDVGQCTVRPGGVRHCGHAVTKGTRYIIGGFCMQVHKVEYVRMLLNMGQLAESVEERKKALEVAIALNPAFDGPYTNLADLLVKEGETEQAKQVLEYCLEHVNPNCGEVAYTLGSIHYDQGNYGEAKRCMQVCLDVDESDIEAMLLMAQTNAGEGNRDGEKEWYERLVATPGASDKAVASAYCNLGVLHEGQDEEINYYRKSLALAPEIFATRYSLACAYASREQWTEAAQEFRAALSYGARSADEELQAIKSLYRVAMQKIQKDHPQGVAAREVMLQLFQEIMGVDNFNKLAAASKK